MIPLSTDRVASPVADDLAVDRTQTIKKRALLVDDSAFARGHTRNLVEALGLQVTEASSGAVAIEHCRHHFPDLVLLDLVMPDMSGMETLRRLRQIRPGLKVVVISADVQAATQKDAKAAGALGYITKPLTPLTLSCMLALVLHENPAALPTPLQAALSDLMTRGYDRAAAALSTLTRDRVVLEPPNLFFLPIEEVGAVLAKNVGEQVVAVNQVFAGPVGGNAMLLFDQEAAMQLTKLVDTREMSQEFGRARQDIITEVGNILLNACLGVFGTMLRVQVWFSVPRLQMEDTSRLFASIVTENELKHAVVIQSRFTLREGKISGFFLMILGISSLEAVIRELELKTADTA